jgi:PAS domain S-box-containing protein
MLKSVVESAPDIICQVDLDGTLRFINRMGDNLNADAGVTPESLVGASFYDFINEDERPIVRDALARVAETGKVVSYEVRGLDGFDPNLYSTRLGPVVRNGVVVGALAVCTNISERVRSDEERDALRAQLDEAKRLEAIGRLAGGVAHDFNNLLTVIRGNLDLLKPRVLGTSMDSSLSAISRATDRATQMSRQLLALSKHQEHMLRRLLGEEVDVVFEPSSDVRFVHADRIQLERVIINLCTNGRDAMPSGGRLLLRTRVAPPSAEDGQARAELQYAIDVIDSGTGIDEETQRHMFEPFFTTKEHGRGTGLGLATVHGIVKQSGGELEVASEPGQGTRISVLLPGKTSAKHSEPAPAPLQAPLVGTETILLVEDEPAVRQVTQQILELGGFVVRVAPSAEEALSQSDAELADIDLLLSDVVMPKTSGPDLAKALVARMPKLRVLFMSGYSEQQVQNRGLATDRAAFVHKPFTADALIAMVRQVLDA